MRSALAVLGTAALLAGLGQLLKPDPQKPAPHGEPSPSGPAVVLSSDLQSRAPQPAAPAEDRSQPRARRVPAAATTIAQQFLLAYLQWETGNRDPIIERTLRDSAAPRLRALLESSRGQPQRTRKTSEAQLAYLMRRTVGSNQAATLAATLRRDGEFHGLAVVARKLNGQWRVVSIGP